MNLDRKHLVSLTLDVEEGALIGVYSLPQGDGSYVEYTGELSLDPNDAEPSFLTDVRLLVERATQLLSQGKKPADCGSCTGNCCKTYDVVEVMPNDLHRMKKGGLDVDRLVTKYRSASVTGAVGRLTLTKKKRCLSLGKDGRCGIYSLRPQTCRDYAAAGCDIYEPKEEKKKHRLKVVD